MISVMSHSVILLGFAVASCTAVMYDWGKPDSTHQGKSLTSIPALNLGQEVCLCRYQSNHFTKTLVV
jgi:hypothetical protein